MVRIWKAVLGTAVALCLLSLGVPVRAQFLGEQQAAMGMMDTLNSTSTGPPGSVVGRVRERVEGAPAPSPVPAVAPAAPAPSGPGGEPASGEAAAAPPPPASDEDGTPFSYVGGAQFANQGMIHLRSLRFNEAVDAYRQAKDTDPRYKDMFENVTKLRDSVNAGKMDEIKKEKVKAGFDLTWEQFLGWERQSPQALGYTYAPGLGPLPGMQGGGKGGPMIGAGEATGAF